MLLPFASQLTIQSTLNSSVSKIYFRDLKFWFIKILLNVVKIGDFKCAQYIIPLHFNIYDHLLLHTFFEQNILKHFCFQSCFRILHYNVWDLLNYIPLIIYMSESIVDILYYCLNYLLYIFLPIYSNCCIKWSTSLSHFVISFVCYLS